MKKPRIAMLSMHTHHIFNYTAFTFAIFKAYAEKHGYDFLPQTEGFDTTRQLSWSNIQFVKKYLPQYDIVVWIDPDIVITNSEISIESIVERAPSGDVYICEEEFKKGQWGQPYRKNVNTGVMIFCNAEFSYSLIDAMLSVKRDPKLYRWAEQSRLIEIIETKEIELSRLILCDQKQFNSLYITNHWSEGDLLVHFAGYDLSYYKPKYPIIKEFANRYMARLPIKPPRIDEYFGRTVTINLDRRIDRMESFTERAQKIEMRFERAAATDSKLIKIPYYIFGLSNVNELTPGAYSLCQSTLSILQEAIVERRESVLIMEDDIDFDDNANEILLNAMLELPADWDCLFLAKMSNPSPHRAIGLKYWEKSSWTYTCAMYVVRSTIFEKYASFLKSPTMPIDIFMVKEIQPKFNCYSLKRSISWQLSGESDIAKSGCRNWQKGTDNQSILIQ